MSIEDAKTNRDDLKPGGRVPVVVILILSIVGLVLSSYLTNIHYLTHTDPSYDSMCALNEKVNCETVAESPYSVFLSLPISVWGLIGFSLFIVLTAWGLIPGKLHERWPRGIIFLMTLGSFAASATLAYVSFFKIESMCIFCMALYGTSAAMLVVGVVMLVRTGVGPLGAILNDLKAMFKKPLAVLALLVVTGGAVTGAQLLVPVYWIHPGWADLPQLPTGVDELGHPWVGAVDPVITVVEFSDYECPYCRKAHRNMRHLIAKYKDDVRMVHRHQPLDQACNPNVKKKFHERACEFARAVECAGAQGQFWPMNDAVFSAQDDIAAAAVDIGRLAVQLGIDRRVFDRCVESDPSLAQIKKDMAEAQERKIKGTPTYFIRSQPYEGGITESVLKAAIDAAKSPKK